MEGEHLTQHVFNKESWKSTFSLGWGMCKGSKSFWVTDTELPPNLLSLLLPQHPMGGPHFSLLWVASSPGLREVLSH